MGRKGDVGEIAGRGFVGNEIRGERGYLRGGFLVVGNLVGFMGNNWILILSGIP